MNCSYINSMNGCTLMAKTMIKCIGVRDRFLLFSSALFLGLAPPQSAVITLDGEIVFKLYIVWSPHCPLGGDTDGADIDVDLDAVQSVVILADPGGSRHRC